MHLVCVHVEHFSNPEGQKVPSGIDEAGNQHCRGEGFQLGQGEGHPHIWPSQSIQDAQALADLQDPLARIAAHRAEGSPIAACLQALTPNFACPCADTQPQVGGLSCTGAALSTGRQLASHHVYTVGQAYDNKQAAEQGRKHNSNGQLSTLNDSVVI